MYKFSLSIALFLYLPLAQGAGTIAGNAKWNSTGKALTAKDILIKYQIDPAESSGGAHSTFRNATLKKTGEKVGVKLEDPNSDICFLPLETQVYEDLQKRAPNLLDKGFANIYDYGTLNKKRVLILSRFGMDMIEYAEKQNRHYEWDELRDFAKTVIDEIQFLHEAGWIHQDIKCDNLMYGIEDPKKFKNTKDVRVSFNDRIYMIDLGSAVRYRDKKTKALYKQTATLPSTTTTELYMSRTHRNGLSLSRRDDMETLGYVMINAAGAKLPWADSLKNEVRNKTKITAEQDILCEKLQIGAVCREWGVNDKRIQRAIRCYFKLVKSLFNEKDGFFAEPDYEAFKKCFDVTLGEPSSSSMTGSFGGL